jgi:hypothetical protein
VLQATQVQSVPPSVCTGHKALQGDIYHDARITTHLSANRRPRAPCLTYVRYLRQAILLRYQPGNASGLWQDLYTCASVRCLGRLLHPLPEQPARLLAAVVVVT